MMESSDGEPWGLRFCLSSSPNFLTFDGSHDPTGAQFPHLQNGDKNVFVPSAMGSLGRALILVCGGSVSQSATMLTICSVEGAVNAGEAKARLDRSCPGGAHSLTGEI